MQNGAAVLGGKLYNGVEPVHNGGHGGVGTDDGLGVLLDDLLNEGGDVLVVVVKGVAVDAAPLHNVLHGDVVQGALLQKMDEGLLDRPSGEIRHADVLPFSGIFYKYSTERMKIQEEDAARSAAARAGGADPANCGSLLRCY